MVCPFLLASQPSFAVTKVLSKGQMLLMRDAKEAQYGAVRAVQIEPKKNRMVFRWFLPPENSHNLAEPSVASGTVEVRQVRGRAVVAFGPFVLEWHGSAEGKGIFSANGALGIQPMFVASSAINEPTRLQNIKEGFKYELATTREVPSPLGLTETFADLPQARLGVAVAETFVKDDSGVELPTLRISGVDDESKAYAAGIRESQEVTAFNHEDIFSAADFHDHLKLIKPGDKVTLTILENGESRDIVFDAAQRVGSPSVQPTPTVDPSLPPEERARLEKNQDVLRVMQEAVEALRAVHFD
jgi:hypothetical protein